MIDRYETEAVDHILMNVIGEALIKADASFLFGTNFSDILEKYGPLLRRKPIEIDIIRKEIQELKDWITETNKDFPFPGSTCDLFIDRLNQIEYDVCDDPQHILA